MRLTLRSRRWDARGRCEKIVADAFVDGLPQQAVGRARAEGDLRVKYRLDPCGLRLVYLSFDRWRGSNIGIK
jgi:hypothetical protein